MSIEKFREPPEEETEVRRPPKVPWGRRSAAFAIDFFTIWLISLPFGGAGLLQSVVFACGWICLRVFLPANNRGQSLGRWAMDMKVLEDRANRIPTLIAMMKREGITGVGAVLAANGLAIGLSNAMILVLLTTPLLVDCVLALGDEDYRQAFHDRLAKTITAQSQRGFSLDLRLKKLVAKIQRSMRQ